MPQQADMASAHMGSPRTQFTVWSQKGSVGYQYPKVPRGASTLDSTCLACTP